ncbi:hypothetical protein ACFX2B_000408 [Malus domestica]
MVDQYCEDPSHKDKEMATTTEGANLLLYLKRKLLGAETARKLEYMKYKVLSQNGLYSYARTKRKAPRIEVDEAPLPQGAISGPSAPQEAIEGASPRGRRLPGEPQLQVIQGLFYGKYAPPDLPPVPSLRSLIQVHSKPFEKQLTSSDVRDDQSRLSMCKEDVENHIFPLLKDDEDPNRGIPVTTYDMGGNEYPMVFKTWVSKTHVLTGGWKSFCHDRGLVEKIDFVTVWVFRNVVNGSLCFAINSRRFPAVSEAIKKRRRQN